MAEIIWTKKARGQLERAIKYIYKEQGCHYADIVWERILKTTKLLENQLKLDTIDPLTHKKSEL